MRSFLGCFILVFVTISIFAHPGALDSRGGHYNRKTGEYHYHRGSSGSQKSYSKPKDNGLNDEFLKANGLGDNESATNAAPATTKTNIPEIKEDPSAIPTFDIKEWKHWIDADGNKRNTEEEILLRTSKKRITYYSNLNAPETTYYKNDRIMFGEWVDSFTGETLVPAAIVKAIHIVPLKNAYFSGGSNWSSEKKMNYANDLDSKNHILITRSDIANMRRDRPPTEWMPPNKSFHKQYIILWYTIKTNWGLSLEEGFDEISNKVFSE